MRITILSLFISLLNISIIYSQNKDFKWFYSYESSEVYGIAIKKPKGFRIIPNDAPWIISKQSNIGMLYRFVLQSKNEECIIMYPSIMYDPNPWSSFNEDLAKSMAVGELEAALNISKNEKKDISSYSNYISILTDDSAKDIFNADTVYISRIPLTQPYKDNYKYCTGIYAYKKDRAQMLLKVFFTEDGKQREDYYLKKLYRAIRYRDGNWEYDKEKKQKVREKIAKKMFR